MATATENKLREDVQRKKPKDLYVLAGEDPFKLDFYADSLFHSFASDGGKREILYGDELDPWQLLDQVRTPSLWDPLKFILVRQGERIPAKKWEVLIPLLSEPFERCCLVFQCTKTDARLKFFQALGKAADRAVLVKMEPAGLGEASQWLRSFLKAAGKEADESAKDLLLEWTAGSLSELKQLVEKAALFAGEDPSLRREHIQAVGSSTAPEDIFRFTGAVLEGNRAGALGVLEGLLRQGEEPLALLGLLSRQYRWLLSILALRAEGKPDSAIASAAGIFPAAARVLFPAARRMGSKGVIRGLQALAETDHGLKSSRLPKDQLMTGLVIRLTD